MDSTEEAERLGRSITGARLAACVQIVGPIRSLYWWQDKLDDAQEWLLLIKTTSERLAELEQHIKENHSLEAGEKSRYPRCEGRKKSPDVMYHVSGAIRIFDDPPYYEGRS